LDIGNQRPIGESVRRADRLFEIIQYIRRKALVRARDLSEHLEVSARTIYRDIQVLITSGVPIDGEAGVGYVLKADFELLPLMFREQETEALVLGAHIVESWADPELVGAASDVIAKVEVGSPTASAATWPTRPCSHRLTTVWSRSASTSPICAVRCVANSKSISATAMPWKNRRNGPCGRSASPISAWCELCQDFRTFRLDRIDGFSVETDRFRPESGKTLHDFLKRDQTWTRGYGAMPNGNAQKGLSAVGTRNSPKMNGRQSEEADRRCCRIATRQQLTLISGSNVRILPPGPER
jgi:biotin operon repressor